MTSEAPEDWLPSHEANIRARAEYEREHGIEWGVGMYPRPRRKLYAIFQESYARSFSVERELDEAITNFVHTNSANYGSQHNSVDEALGGGALSEWSVMDSHELPDWLAAIPIMLERFEEHYGGQRSMDEDYSVTMHFDAASFCERANEVLLEERFSFTYLGTRLRPRDEEPLHKEIVLPVEAALTSDPRFSQAEASYISASYDLASGDFAGCVMQCSTMLQSVFRALDCDAQTLGAQFTQAKQRGFLMQHDTHLISSIHALTQWITANRSGRSTAHEPNDGTKEDAQLALHISSALALRLIHETSPNEVVDDDPF